MSRTLNVNEVPEKKQQWPIKFGNGSYQGFTVVTSILKASFTGNTYEKCLIEHS